ncbi:MAG: HAMP domain-containing protein [Candidatus Omnitrophota bacterium]|nr:hypothetical protein [Candidatus Omnitrophota bacterium]
MIIPTVVVGGCLYFFIFTVMAEQLVLPDIIARDLMPVIQSINVILVIGLPIVFFVLLTWAVILSYRFVAPLERLEEDIKLIDEGDYSVRLKINRDHDLAPIAGVINDLVAQLEENKGRNA